MYAQATIIRVPLGTMSQMRHIIEHDYLPRVRSRPGFLSAQMLEQIDDPESAILVLYWDNQAAVEGFNRTNPLEASVQALAVRLPGTRIHREGYVVSVQIDSAHSGVHLNADSTTETPATSARTH